jgi:uncharacterized membrane protein YfcA
MNPAEAAALLGAAGVLAGTVGTAGGITSLISYPALLATGVAPLAANVANLVALVVCWPGSALASQPELRGRASWLRAWTAVTVTGGLAGTVLLLSTPTRVFARVIPFLVAGGALSLLLQPVFSARRRGGARPARRPLLPAGLFAVSVYNGYFGAGSGVMALALLLHAVERHIARANALKNMLMGAATAASGLLLALVARVDWTAVAPLAAGLLVGSLLGPVVARHTPAALLRWLVALLGIAVAVQLWLSAG